MQEQQEEGEELERERKEGGGLFQRYYKFSECALVILNKISYNHSVAFGYVGYRNQHVMHLLSQCNDTDFIVTNDSACLISYLHHHHS